MTLMIDRSQNINPSFKNFLERFLSRSIPIQNITKSSTIVFKDSCQTSFSPADTSAVFFEVKIAQIYINWLTSC